MADTTFSDNLYAGLGGICAEGAGLIAFCRCGAWFYERHANGCKPGMWSVGMTAEPSGEFWTLVGDRAAAVVDDFGNLRRVQ